MVRQFSCFLGFVNSSLQSTFIKHIHAQSFYQVNSWCDLVLLAQFLTIDSTLESAYNTHIRHCWICNAFRKIRFYWGRAIVLLENQKEVIANVLHHYSLHTTISKGANHSIAGSELRNFSTKDQIDNLSRQVDSLSRQIREMVSNQILNQICIALPVIMALVLVIVVRL